MVRQKKYRSIKKTRSKRSVNKKKSRKKLKSKKHNDVSRYQINGNVSGYVHQVKCHNNICTEYKQQINSLDDFNKLFGMFKI